MGYDYEIMNQRRGWKRMTDDRSIVSVSTLQELQQQPQRIFVLDAAVVQVSKPV